MQRLSKKKYERAQILLDKASARIISLEEKTELDKIVAESQSMMLRNAKGFYL